MANPHDTAILGSPIIEACVYDENLALIKTEDGKGYAYYPLDGEIADASLMNLGMLLQGRPNPAIIRENLPLKDIQRLCRLQQAVLDILDLFLLGIDPEAQPENRAEAVIELDDLLSVWGREYRVVNLLERVISIPKPAAADFTGAMRIAENLQAIGSQALLLYQIVCGCASTD